MKPQTRIASAVETILSTVIGFGVSLALTYTVLPAFGHNVTGFDAWGITAIFTAASIARGYAVRRLFNYRRDS